MRLRFIIPGIFVAVFCFSFLLRSYKKTDDLVEAASLATFNPGYIISDYQMGNYNSMTEEEIQEFLTSKNRCTNTNYSYYQQLSAGSPGYVWHFEDGHFVCLSEEKFGDGEEIGSGDTAAHIIWQTAQDYQINPQVLLVLLQKETGLITDPIPNNMDYRKATGYGCPDTAACSSKYYGFKNQIRNAAALFRAVLDGGWTNFPLGENYIQYNPNASCGGSVVTIRNLATSALYRYTPYQPNEGALAAGYGTAYCGAYGNRNFYLYFEDWFGGIGDEGVVNAAVVESGRYSIKSGLTNNLGLEWKNEKMVNSSELGEWIVKWDDSGYYTIQNANEAYLCVVKKGDDYVLEIKESDISKSKLWMIVENNDKSLTFVPYLYQTLALDVKNGSTKEGTEIWLYERIDNNAAQKWIVDEYLPMDIDGEYYIISELFNSKAIDVSGGSKANGANVQIYQHSDGNNAQKWIIKKNEKENYYTIVNPQSNKALDVENGVLSNNSNVQIYDVNNSCAQRWVFKKKNNGSYRIQNYCNNNIVLDVQDYKTNVQIYSRAGEDNFGQGWLLKKIESQKLPLTTDANQDYSSESDLRFDGVYSLHPLFDNGKALDVENGSYKDMANAQIYTFWTGNMAQEWEIQKKEDYYIIRNVHSRKVLDVEGGILENNTNVC